MWQNLEIFKGGTNTPVISCLIISYFQLRRTNILLVCVSSELLSTPDISYTVVKMGEHNYIADITCRCARGDPPITFSLYMGDELIHKTTSSERQSTISIRVEMDQQSGWLRCQAKKDEQTENSRWLSFEIGRQKHSYNTVLCISFCLDLQ